MEHVGRGDVEPSTLVVGFASLREIRWPSFAP
jgi:hypothetical protein